MALDPRRFRGVDEMVHGKVQSLEEMQRKKADILQSKIDRYAKRGVIEKQHDLDSMLIRYQNGQTEEIRSAGGGLDAPDSYFGGKTPAAQAKAALKRAKQAQAYSDLTDIPVDAVTDNHLKAWKDTATAAGSKAGFGEGDSIYHIPTGEVSSLKGDDRTMTGIYNQKNQNLAETFNTPETNAGYREAYNDTFRRKAEYAQAQALKSQVSEEGPAWDKDGKPKATLRGDGSFSYGDMHNLREEQIPWASYVEKSNIDNLFRPAKFTADPIASITNSALGSFGKFNSAVIAPIHGHIQDFTNWATGERETSQMTLAGAAKTWNNMKGITAPQDVISEQHLQQWYLLNNGQGDEDVEIPAAQLKALEKLSSDVNKNVLESAAIQDASDKFLNEIYASGGDTAINNAFNADADKNGVLSAIGSILLNEPIHAIDQVAQSIPVMLTMFTGLGFGLMVQDKYQRAVVQRTKDGNNEPITNDEDNIIRAASIAAAVFERLGAEILLKKIPGMGRVAEGLIKLSPAASRILTPVLKVGATSIGEGVSELGTNLSEQSAAKATFVPTTLKGLQKAIDGIDVKEAGYATSLGIGGGGGLSSPRAAIELVRGQKAAFIPKLQELGQLLIIADTIGGTSEGTRINARIVEIDALIGNDAAGDPAAAILKTEKAALIAELAKPNPNALSADQKTKIQKQYDALSEALDGYDPVGDFNLREATLTAIQETLDGDILVRDVDEGAALLNTVAEVEKEIADNGETPELTARLADLNTQLDTPVSEEAAAQYKADLQTQYDALKNEPVKPADKPSVKEDTSNKEAINEDDFAAVIASIKLDEDTDGKVAYRDFAKAADALSKIENRGMTPIQQNEFDALWDRLNKLDQEERVAYPAGAVAGSIDGARKVVTGEAPLPTITEDSSASDKQLNTALKKAKKLGTAIRTAAGKTKNSIFDVFGDVATGKTKRFKGFETYLEEIAAVEKNSSLNDLNRDQQITAIKDRLANHIENTKTKAKVFKEAQEIAAGNGLINGEAVPKGHVVTISGTRQDSESKTNRLMNFTIGTMTAKEAQALRDDGLFVNTVTEQSGNLVEAIQKEAEYAQSIENVLKQHAGTSYAKEARTQQISNDKTNAQLKSLGSKRLNTQAGEEVDLSTIGTEAVNEPTDTAGVVTPVDGSGTTEQASKPTEQASTADTATAPVEPATTKETTDNTTEVAPEIADATKESSTVAASETVIPTEPTPLPKPGRKEGTRIVRDAQATTTETALSTESLSKQAIRSMFPNLVNKDGTLTENITESGLQTLAAALEVEPDAVKATLKALPATKHFVNSLSNSLRASINKAADKLAGIFGKSFNDLIKVNDKAGVGTIPTEVFQNKAALIQALQDLGVSKDTAIELEGQYRTFAGWFAGTHVDEDFAKAISTLKYPVLLLTPKDGTIPPQVVFALMLGAKGWAAQNPKNNRFRTPYDRKMFLYNGNQEPSLTETEQLQELGYGFNDTANSIGATLTQVLGFSPTNVETSIYYDHLVTALGMATINAGQGTVSPKEVVFNENGDLVLEKNGLVGTGLFTILKRVWDFGPIEVSNRNFQTGDTYKHIVINEIDESSPEGAAQIEANKEIMKDVSTHIVKDLDPDTARLPLDEAQTQTPNKIKNSFGLIPKFVDTVLGKLQKVSWSATSSMPVFSSLGDTSLGRAMLLKLAGYQDIVKDLDHETVYASREASNRDKEQAVDDLVYANKKGRLGIFYYAYQIMNNHRIVMQGMLNAQRSHITRHLVSPAKAVRYSASISKDAVAGTPATGNMHLFKLAILFNLGYKVDKKRPSNIDSAYANYASNENVIAAAKAVNGPEAARDKALIDLLPKIQKDLGGDISVLPAIIALAAMAKANNGNLQHADGTSINSFESDILLEIDGIANGTAITALQLPHFHEDPEQNTELLDRTLNLTGTYRTRSKAEAVHLVSGLFKDMEGADAYLDVYTAFGDVITQKADPVEVQEFYNKRDDARIKKGDKPLRLNIDDYIKENGAVSALSRALREGDIRDAAKTVLMISQYGGSTFSIAMGAASNVVEDSYDALNDLQKRYSSFANSTENTVEILDEKAALGEEISTFLDHVETLGGFEYANEGERFVTSKEAMKKAIRSGTSQNKYFNDSTMMTKTAYVFLPRFTAALEETSGASKKVRDALTQATEIMHFIHTQIMDKALTKAKEDNNNVELSNKQIDAVVEENRQWLPQAPGVLMNNENETATIDLSAREVDKGEDLTEEVRYAHTDYRGNSATHTSKPKRLKFVAAGASAMVRQIINIDSALLTSVLNKFPNVLMLHDAFMGDPETLAKISKMYGELYLKFNKEHSIFEATATQLGKVMRDLEALDKAEGTQMMAAVEKAFNETAFINTNNEGQLVPPNERVTFQEALGLMRSEYVNNQSARETIPGESDGISSQMYMVGALDTVEDLEGEGTRYYSPRIAEIGVKADKKRQEMFLEQSALEGITSAALKFLQQRAAQLGGRKVAELFNTYAPAKAKDFIRLSALKAKGQRSKQQSDIAAIITELNSQLTEADEIGGAGLLSKMLIAHEQDVDVRGKGTIVAAAYKASLDNVGDNVYAQMMKIINAELKTNELNGVVFREEAGLYSADIAALRKELNSLDGLDKGETTVTHVMEITADNTMKLLNRFKQISGRHYASKEDADGHLGLLDNVMRILTPGIESAGSVRLTVEQIEGITQGTYNTIRDKVTVSLSKELPPSSNGQSPAEVYVHEVVHAITMAARRAHPLISVEIQKLYDQVKAEVDSHKDSQGNNIGWQIFLEGNTAAATPEDINLAKTMYDNLFNNPGNEANILDEFLANSVANRGLIRYLQNSQQSLPVRDNTLIGKFLSVMDKLIDVVVRSARNNTRNNRHQDTIALLERLIAVQNKHESRLQQHLAKVYNTSDVIDNKIRDIARNQATKLIAADSTNSLKNLGTAVVGSAKLYLSDNALAAKIKLRAHSSMHRATWETISDIGEGGLSPQLTERLLAAKNKIQKQRETTERDFIQWFDEIFVSTKGSDLKADVTEALTDVMLRTELSSLLEAGATHQYIVSLIAANATSTKRIRVFQQNLLGQLQASSSNKIDIKRYATALGVAMATRKITEHDDHQNGKTIAQTFMPKHTEKDVRLIEAYATLEALMNTQANVRNKVAELSNAEFANNANKNAFIDMLDYHKFYADESVRRLFNNNRTQRMHGYIEERVDNLTDVQAGTVAQASTMRAGGYTEPFNISKIPGVKMTNTVLYVSRNMPQIKDVSGIISTTGRTHMGTTLSEIFMKEDRFIRPDGTIRHKAIRNEIQKIAKQERKKGKAGIANTTQLSPLRDDAGNTVDYRIMMDNSNKHKLLRPDLEFQNVFAHMQSGFVDKEQTIINDKLAIDTLAAEQLEVMTENPEIFMNFMDPDGPYYQRYLMLPREVKEYLHQYVGKDGKFMVRAEIINKVFGYKAGDLSNLGIFQPESMARAKHYARLLHYTAKAGTSYVKMLYVLATPAVMLGNIASNLTQLTVMQKIPPAYVYRKYQEGIVEYTRYRNDTENSRKLKNEIDAKGLPVGSPEMDEYTRLVARIQNNKLHRLNEFGLNSMIVEDLNSASANGFINRSLKMMMGNKHISRLPDRIPNTVNKTASILFMTKGTAPGQMTRQMVQLTDFLTRYVMIEHATEVKGQDFTSAVHEAIPAFILFDENLPPWLEVLEGINLTMFVSFWLRAPRVAKKLITTSPTGVAAAAALQWSTDAPMLGVINSTWMMGKFLPNYLQQGDSLDKMFGLPAIDFVEDIVKD